MRLFLLAGHLPRRRVLAILGDNAVETLERLRILVASPGGVAAGATNEHQEARVYSTVQLVPVISDVFVVTPWPYSSMYCTQARPFCEHHSERHDWLRVQPVGAPPPGRCLPVPIVISL